MQPLRTGVGEAGSLINPRSLYFPDLWANVYVGSSCGQYREGLVTPECFNSRRNRFLVSQ